LRLSHSAGWGQSARYDYEYERIGTANLMFAPLEGWRRVKVTDRRTAVDYAQALEEWAADRSGPAQAPTQADLPRI
jgi:hypothetical protein